MRRDKLCVGRARVDALEMPSEENCRKSNLLTVAIVGNHVLTTHDVIAVFTDI